MTRKEYYKYIQELKEREYGFIDNIDKKYYYKVLEY